jgi:hypothetical protein
MIRVNRKRKRRASKLPLRKTNGSDRLGNMVVG